MIPKINKTKLKNKKQTLIRFDVRNEFTFYKRYLMLMHYGKIFISNVSLIFFLAQTQKLFTKKPF